MKVNFEHRIVAGVINNNSLIPLVISILREQDFVEVESREAFRLVMKQYREFGYVNYAWAIENLRNPESLIKGSWSLDQMKEFCLRVQTDSQKKQIELLAASIQDSTKVLTSSPQEIISNATSQLFKIGATSSNFSSEKKIGDLVSTLEEEQKKYSGRTLLGYNTGYDSLNKLTKGMEKKQLWIIGGYTSYGKSWFCVDLAWRCRSQGAKVLYITLEMNAQKIAWRIASLELHLNEYQMLTGNINVEQKETLGQFFNFLRLDDTNFWICDGLTTGDDIFYKILEMKARHGLDVVVIDYIQNISVKGKEEYEALTGLARDLQRVAVTQNLLMIVASQNNRESLKGGKGFGYHGSSQIEKAADVGIVLDKPDEETANYNLIFNVGKNRNGMTGEINMLTNFSQGRIEDKGLRFI